MTIDSPLKYPPLLQTHLPHRSWHFLESFWESFLSLSLQRQGCKNITLCPHLPSHLSPCDIAVKMIIKGRDFELILDMEGTALC